MLHRRAKLIANDRNLPCSRPNLFDPRRGIILSSSSLEENQRHDQ